MGESASHSMAFCVKKRVMYDFEKQEKESRTAGCNRIRGEMMFHRLGALTISAAFYIPTVKMSSELSVDHCERICWERMCLRDIDLHPGIVLCQLTTHARTNKISL